jgi:chromosome segregation ATPase
MAHTITSQACMRQAPAWFISELLSKYPESAYMATNLDELPLHLAVDKDCGPEVVNLIIVANLTAIVAQDQAGRTPIDIMNRDELLQLEEYRVVYESLGRCHKTYMELQKASQEEQASIKRKHKATFNAVSKRHQEELKAENDKKAKLRDEIEDLKAQLGDMLEVNKAKDHHLKKNQQEKERWMDTVRDLEAQVLSLQRSLQSEKNQIQELQLKLQQKDENLNHKQDQIDVISNDLRNIVVSNETDVIEALIETEQSMRKMVSNQIALQKLLTSNSKNLTEVLKQRGIRMPREEIQARTQQEIDRALAEEEDEKKVDDPDPVETEAASAAMMAAAMAALQPVTP